MAPSAVTHMKAQSPSAPAPSWDEELFQKRFEEGYDVYDDKYLSWCKVCHLESVPLHHASSGAASSGSNLSGLKCSSTATSSNNTPH